MQQMIGHHREEHVRVHPLLFLMKVRPQAQRRFHAHEGVLYLSQHRVDAPDLFIPQIQAIGPKHVAALLASLTIVLDFFFLPYNINRLQALVRSRLISFRLYLHLVELRRPWIFLFQLSHQFHRFAVPLGAIRNI